MQFLERLIFPVLTVVLLMMVPLPVYSLHADTGKKDHLSLKQAMQQERDAIFMLLAYTIVYRDWQQPGDAFLRGHNIGAVLVDPYGRAVFWARNNVVALDNASRHAEVNLIENFLSCDHRQAFVEGYSVYTTLESCAMCTGMMAMTKVSRVVYGQNDPDYGGVVHKLAADSPYPRLFENVSADFVIQKNRLDQAFQKHKIGIIPFLYSDAAETIYASAANDLEHFQIRFEQNRESLRSALLMSGKDLEEGKIFHAAYRSGGIPEVDIKSRALIKARCDMFND